MDKQQSNQHQKLAERVSAELDRQSEALDATTASRLNQARQRALAELDRPPRHWRRIALIGATATAALALAFSLPRTEPSPPEGSGSLSEQPGLSDVSEQLADFDLLSAQTDLAMLDELDFYLWVGAQLAADLPANGTDPLDDPLDDPFG